MNPTDLARIAEVREQYATGEARRLREEANLSQADWGRGVGASRSAVALWEAGQRSPRGAAALRCAEAFSALRSRRTVSPA